jgi:hypothetical protein
MTAARGLGAAALLVAACIGAGSSGSSATQLARADTLIAGCTGGVTGGGGGSAVTGAGELLRFTQSGPGQGNRRWTLIGWDTAGVRRLIGQLATTEFDRAEFRNPANMTCSLARRGERPREIAWPMGQRPPAIARIVAVHDQIVRMVAAAESH